MTVDELITALENFPQKVATNCEAIMKSEVPVHSGNLKDHVKTVWDGPSSFFVGTDDVSYAKHVYHGRGGFGVGPNGLTSGRKKVLRWIEPTYGGEVFAKHVGPAKANDYVARTISRLRLYLTLH